MSDDQTNETVSGTGAAAPSAAASQSPSELAERVDALERAVVGLNTLVQNEIEKLRATVRKALEMAHSIAGIALPPDL